MAFPLAPADLSMKLILTTYGVTKISELIPLNKKTGLDAFLNESWYKIIIPDMIYTMMVRVLCEDNVS